MDLGMQAESCLMVDGDAQTSRTETTEATTQASFVPATPTTPIVSNVPVKNRVASTTMTFSSELFKDNDQILYRPAVMGSVSSFGAFPLYMLFKSKFIKNQSVIV